MGGAKLPNLFLLQNVIDTDPESYRLTTNGLLGTKDFKNIDNIGTIYSDHPRSLKRRVVTLEVTQPTQ